MHLTTNELYFIKRLHQEAYLLNGRRVVPYPPEVVAAAAEGWQKASTAYTLMLAKVRELGLIT